MLVRLQLIRIPALELIRPFEPLPGTMRVWAGAAGESAACFWLCLLGALSRLQVLRGSASNKTTGHMLLLYGPRSRPRIRGAAEGEGGPDSISG